MRIGSRLEVYRTKRWRWKPEAGLSRMNRSFCGGFHFRWLAISVEYDHLSRAWRIVRSA